MLGGKSYTILQTYDTNARPQTAGPWEANTLKNIKFYLFFGKLAGPRWPKPLVSTGVLSPGGQQVLFFNDKLAADLSVGLPVGTTGPY